MEIPFGEADKLAKLVPEPVAGQVAADARGDRADARAQGSSTTRARCYRELLDLAAALEGLNRNAGMHAAGVVIADEPLWEYVPCFRGRERRDRHPVRDKEVEKAGLVKFDFLGLKTLTVIQTCVELINRATRRRGERRFDIVVIPLDDADVYKMISRGRHDRRVPARVERASASC